VPSYDLQCVRCDEGFEVYRQRFLTDGDRTCPSCGAEGARTLLTSFVTSRPPRQSAEPRVTGFAGHGCCGGACSHG